MLSELLALQANEGKLFIRFGDLGYGDDRVVPVDGIEVDSEGNICLSAQSYCCHPLEGEGGVIETEVDKIISNAHES